MNTKHYTHISKEVDVIVMDIRKLLNQCKIEIFAELQKLRNEMIVKGYIIPQNQTLRKF